MIRKSNKIAPSIETFKNSNSKDKSQSRTMPSLFMFTPSLNAVPVPSSSTFHLSNSSSFHVEPENNNNNIYTSTSSLIYSSGMLNSILNLSGVTSRNSTDGGSSNGSYTLKQKQNQLRKQSESVAFRMKSIYLHLASISFIIFSVILFYDWISLGVLETVPISQSWFTLLMLSQVSSIYISILAFIYSSEAGDSTNTRFSLILFASNIVCFILRCTFQFIYANFMPALLSNTLK